MRRLQAQSQAKKAQVIDTPVGQWRGGGKHHPVTRLTANMWLRKRICNPRKAWDEDALILHHSQHTEQYLEWRAEIQRQLSAVPPYDRAQVEIVLSDATAKHCPACPPGRQPGAWQHPNTQVGLRTLCDIRKQLQTFRRGTLLEFLKYWRLAGSLQKPSPRLSETESTST